MRKIQRRRSKTKIRRRSSESLALLEIPWPLGVAALKRRRFISGSAGDGRWEVVVNCNGKQRQRAARSRASHSGGRLSQWRHFFQALIVFFVLAPPHWPRGSFSIALNWIRAVWLLSLLFRFAEICCCWLRIWISRFLLIVVYGWFFYWVRL